MKEISAGSAVCSGQRRLCLCPLFFCSSPHYSAGFLFLQNSASISISKSLSLFLSLCHFVFSVVLSLSYTAFCSFTLPMSPSDYVFNPIKVLSCFYNKISYGLMSKAVVSCHIFFIMKSKKQLYVHFLNHHIVPADHIVIICVGITLTLIEALHRSPPECCLHLCPFYKKARCQVHWQKSDPWVSRSVSVNCCRSAWHSGRNFSSKISYHK